MQESKADWRAIGRLAWPAIVQEALATLVVYADTAMVGALGANASAAVGLTATVGWLGGDEAIRADATAYFTIVSIPLVFRAAVLTL